MGVANTTDVYPQENQIQELAVHRPVLAQPQHKAKLQVKLAPVQPQQLQYQINRQAHQRSNQLRWHRLNQLSCHPRQHIHLSFLERMRCFQVNSIYQISLVRICWWSPKNQLVSVKRTTPLYSGYFIPNLIGHSGRNYFLPKVSTKAITTAVMLCLWVYNLTSYLIRVTWLALLSPCQ